MQDDNKKPKPDDTEKLVAVQEQIKQENLLPIQEDSSDTVQVDPKSLLGVLAKELGYKNYTELKDALGKEQSGRGGRKSAGMGNVGDLGGVGTGFLGGREIGSGFGVGAKKRLAAGQSIGESFKGGLKDFTESLSGENIKRRLLEKTFGGPGFVSSFVRGKLRKKYESKDAKTKSSLSKTNKTDALKPEQIRGSSDEYIKIIAKESMAIPTMARDVNVMRQNLQKLVKIWGGKAATKQEKEKEKSPQKVESGQDDRKEDISWLEEQDRREAEIEASRNKDDEQGATQVVEKEGESGKSLLDKIVAFFSTGFLGAVRSLFNKKMILGILKKAGPIALIVTAIFAAFKGWKKVFETGSFKEGLITGIGTFLDTVTFGIFGEDTVRKVFDSISNFFDPVTETITNIFTGIKDFFVKLFGGQVKVEDKTPKEAEKVKVDAPAKTPGKTAEPESQKSKSLETPTATNTSDSKSPERQTPQKTNEEAKSVEKVSGTKIPLPAGVRYDSATESMIYKDISFIAHNREDLDKMVKSIDEKSVVEFVGKNESGKDVTINFNGATGEQSFVEGNKKLSPTVESGSTVMGDTTVATPAASGGGSGGSVAAAPAASGGGSGGSVAAAPAASGGGGGSVAAAPAASGGGSVAAAPTASGDVSASPTTPSGGNISNASTEVSESQRMESSADGGSTINAPTTTNNSSSSQSGKPKPSSVYDDDLIEMLGMT
jgi:hypothetical protein